MSGNLKSLLEYRLGWIIQSLNPVSGGDINAAYKAILANGEVYFIKTNAYTFGFEMLKGEAEGLDAMRATGATTPRVIDIFETEKTPFLILEWLEPGPGTEQAEYLGGEMLARMHLVHGTFFGWTKDNFIATLRQQNKSGIAWPLFYCSPEVDAPC